MNKQKKRLGSMSLCKVVLICLFLSVFSTAWAAVEQTSSKITVTGVVKDVQGEPLIGATIKIKGSAVGTVSDFDGNYSLANVPVNGVLEFSYVGMNSIEISVSGKKVVNAVLSDATQLLDQVVVIGYGSVKKSDLTGSVATVKPEALSDIPANSVEGLLQGRAAGVQVINSSQDPGAGSTVRIRGNSSLRGSNSPLIVVDGFPLGDAGDLKQINTDDIVSMEVLKDASASAIYGSRGANGVIIVTTRRAKEGTTTVSVKQQLTFSEFSSKLDLWRDPVMMAMLNNEGRVNGGLQPLYIGANNSAGVYYPSIEELQTTWTTNTRWDELVFRDAPVSNNTTVSVSSANEKTSFNLSANYYTDQGMYIDDDYSKGGYNLNVSHKIYKNFTIRASNILYLGNRNNNGGMAYWRNPIYPVYNEDGTYYQTTAQDYSHPIAIREHKKDKTKMLDVISSGAFEWQVIPQLRLTSQLNYKYGKSTNDQYLPQKYTQVGTENRGRGVIGNTENQNFVSETFANYSQMFGKHEVGAMVGHSYEWYQYRDSYLTANGFVNEALGNENMGAGEKANNIISNGFSKSKLVSGMARLNYTYDNKYLLTATFRADGSSKFQGDNKWGYFPSAAIAWDIAQESFMSNQHVLDQLKLRASFGVTGNQDIAAYSTLGMLSGASYGWGTSTSSTGYWGNQFATPDITWEKTYQYDLGLDLSLGGFNITVDWFKKQTKDLLFQKQVPKYNGGGTYWVNQGKLNNTGVEMSLTTFPVKGAVTWETSLNASYVKNEVADLAGDDFVLTANYSDLGGPLQIMKPGYPMGSFYVYQWKGFDDKGANLYQKADGSLTTNPTSDDLVVKGQASPKWTVGWNNTVTWKNWTLNVFFNAATGYDRLNISRFMAASMTGVSRFITLRDAYFKGWDHVANKADALYPSLTNTDNKSYANSDFWLEDASFIKLKNISLSYRIPRRVLKFASVQLSVSAQDLFTITRYKGMDPEVYTSYDGLDYGAYPIPRTITFGAKIRF